VVVSAGDMIGANPLLSALFHDEPTIVTPSGVAGLDFLDEADTVNALAPYLKPKGVETIVVLIHEGGAQVAPAPDNGCVGISGATGDIVNRFDPEVDVVISGHTHNAYNCTINNILVTSASSFGRIAGFHKKRK